jgi:hypothetical protein
MNINVLEAVADILDYADSILEAEGYEIDESIDDPDKFLGVLADMFEDSEVKLSDEAMESLVEVGDALFEALDQELDESEPMKVLGKKGRRTKERLFGKHFWLKPGHEHDVETGRASDLTAHEPLVGTVAHKMKKRHPFRKMKGQLITGLSGGGIPGSEAEKERVKKGIAALKQRLLARKMGKPAEVVPISKKSEKPEKSAEKPAEKSSTPESDAEKQAELERQAAERVAADRKAARNREARANLGLKGYVARKAAGIKEQTPSEPLELEVEQQLVRMAEVVEAAGYVIDEDLTICEFLEAISIILDGNALSENIASEIAEGLKLVQGRCGCGSVGSEARKS